jgi:FMN phosphatase YigB (HAD superfamily)
LTVIALFVIDAGDTLGTYTGPDTVEVLKHLSPLNPRAVGEESRRVLHRNHPLTAEHVADLCAALLIDPSQWPDPWPANGFVPFPDTNAVLADLARIAPIEVLTNLAVTTGPSRMTALREACGQHIGRIHTSYQRGLCKPDYRLWKSIALERGIHPGDIVHIGDGWTQDVRGAVAAGCRAIHVSTHGRPAPHRRTWPADEDRIGVAGDLRGVLDIVHRW